MDLSIILTLLKDIPSGIAGVIAAIAVAVSFFIKQKDIDLGQVTAISKLHMEQLKFVIDQNQTLLDNNKSMAEELHNLRKELSEAYAMIDDMRQRITELEDMLKKKDSGGT